VNIVILGCSRTGAALATKLDRAGHSVTIIDRSSEAFNRLERDFRGKKVIGNGVDGDDLKRAGIETADAFAAVTNGDNRNIMASQLVKEIFRVKKVVCRIYDPLRAETYQGLGLEVFCPTVVITQLFIAALLGSKQSAQ